MNVFDSLSTNGNKVDMQAECNSCQGLFVSQIMLNAQRNREGAPNLKQKLENSQHDSRTRSLLLLAARARLCLIFPDFSTETIEKTSLSHDSKSLQTESVSRKGHYQHGKG